MRIQAAFFFLARSAIEIVVRWILISGHDDLKVLFWPVPLCLDTAVGERRHLRRQ